MSEFFERSAPRRKNVLDELLNTYSNLVLAFPSLASTRLHALNVVVTLVKISGCSNNMWNCYMFTLHSKVFDTFLYKNSLLDEILYNQ